MPKNKHPQSKADRIAVANMKHAKANKYNGKEKNTNLRKRIKEEIKAEETENELREYTQYRAVDLR